jgi:hypothetical protein
VYPRLTENRNAFASNIQQASPDLRYELRRFFNNILGDSTPAAEIAAVMIVMISLTHAECSQ